MSLNKMPSLLFFGFSDWGIIFWLSAFTCLDFWVLSIFYPPSQSFFETSSSTKHSFHWLHLLNCSGCPNLVHSRHLGPSFFLSFWGCHLLLFFFVSPVCCLLVLPLFSFLPHFIEKILQDFSEKYPYVGSTFWNFTSSKITLLQSHISIIVYLGIEFNTGDSFPSDFFWRFYF